MRTITSIMWRRPAQRRHTRGNLIGSGAARSRETIQTTSMRSSRASSVIATTVCCALAHVPNLAFVLCALAHHRHHVRYCIIVADDRSIRSIRMIVLYTRTAYTCAG